MLYSVPENEIEKLSLEMIIYYMFKDYLGIIDWYNNELIPDYRSYNVSLERVRESLIKFNADILGGNSDENSMNFLIKEFTNTYKAFKTEENLEKSKTFVENMRFKEDTEREAEKMEMESIII